MIESVREDVARKARRLLAGGIAGDPLVAAAGVTRRPIPIRSADRSVVGWFVPVAVGRALAGFMQFDARRALRRYAAFQRRRGTVEGCPAAKAWTDPKTVASVAAGRLGKGFRPGAPFLTYDGILDRIVWAVPARNARRDTRVAYVAGEHAYLRAGEPGSETK